MHGRIATRRRAGGAVTVSGIPGRGITRREVCGNVTRNNITRRNTADRITGIRVSAVGRGCGRAAHSTGRVRLSRRVSRRGTAGLNSLATAVAAVATVAGRRRTGGRKLRLNVDRKFGRTDKNVALSDIVGVVVRKLKGLGNEAVGLKLREPVSWKFRPVINPGLIVLIHRNVELGGNHKLVDLLSHFDTAVATDSALAAIGVAF